MLTLSVDGPVGTVLLNRPPVNAWDDAALDRLDELIRQLNRRPDIQVVVVRSANKVFSAGGDVKQMAASLERNDIDALNRFTARIQASFNAWSRLGPVTLAVIDGDAVGGGLEFALACDLRILTSRARVGLAEVRLGLLAAGGGTQRLPELIGRAAALRLMLTGELIDGREAYRLGIGQWLVGSDEASEQTDRLVALLQEGDGHAQRSIKWAVAAADGGDGFGEELRAQAELHATPETQRRLSAFVRARSRR